MKVGEVIKRLKEDGWVPVRMRGDHHNFKKEGNPFVVTVPGQKQDEVSPGVLSDIRRKAGLSLR